MKTLVVYTSRESGNTRKVAEAIAARLGNHCVLAAVADAPPPENFDFIALGFGVYRGWPDGDMRAYMKRCRHRDVGLFMTLGAYPDSEHAANCLGRAEGLLESCRVRVKFACQGAYTPEFLARLKSLPPTSSHGWTPEREKRVLEAMKHPDAADLQEAAGRFAAAVSKGMTPAAVAAPPQAIVMAVFGSTVPQALAAYDQLEAALRRARPGIPVYRAYLSWMVRRKLDFSVPSPATVLQRLQLRGITSVDVSAGLLATGEEYHRLLLEVAAFSGAMTLRVSRPPLDNLDSLRGFLARVAMAVPDERHPGESVIFMGHGNRDGRSDFAYRTAAAELARLDGDFHLACVEGHPDFEEVLPQLRPGRVWLVPFMLVAGDHACHDMAGPEPDSWRSRLNAAGYECGCVLHGLGETAAVADYFAERLG